MPVDLHYICKRGENHRMIWERIFDTGNWTADTQTSELALDGRIYLHENQRALAWHGGTIAGFRSAPSPENHRKIFTYVPDIEFRIPCPIRWSQQRAVVWWNEDRTARMTRSEYLGSHRSKLIIE
jgi:hypothetical protein